MRKPIIYEDIDKAALECCTLCPRECRVNRIKGELGYCGLDDGLNINSICVHRGEEPAISGTEGICNIFFSGCNLHCIYCQNHEISRAGVVNENVFSGIDSALDTIENLLAKGVSSVGFVSPSHVIPQVKAIIKGLNSRGLHPVTVYNSGGYDKVETLRLLADYIDVYLVDYKYNTTAIASELSDAYVYPEIVIKAIKEMYYQKGSTLITDAGGRAKNGMIIRHLVLPGHINESLNVLRSIAENISVGVHISLMAQYHPAYLAESHPILGRKLYESEYVTVVEEMEKLGFRNGYVQDLESNINYRPDFSKEHPFE